MTSRDCDQTPPPGLCRRQPANHWQVMQPIAAEYDRERIIAEALGLGSSLAPPPTNTFEGSMLDGMPAGDAVSFDVEEVEEDWAVLTEWKGVKLYMSDFSSTGYAGVVFQDGIYRARYSRVDLGRHPTAADAAVAYALYMKGLHPKNPGAEYLHPVVEEREKPKEVEEEEEVVVLDGVEVAGSVDDAFASGSSATSSPLPMVKQFKRAHVRTNKRTVHRWGRREDAAVVRIVDGFGGKERLTWAKVRDALIAEGYVERNPQSIGRRYRLVKGWEPGPRIIEKPKRWSSDEDKALFALIRQHETEKGVDWKPVVVGMAAAGYESRTSSCCRNRFLRYKRGKKEVNKGLDMNICHLCGQLRKGHVCSGIFNVASDGLRREVCE